MEILKTIFQLYVALFLQLLRGPWRGKEVLDAIVSIGLGSLPIIAISTTFAGLVVTHEIAWHMDQALHSVQMIPGFTGQFILRELGVAIPALLLVSKVGASITAEIGTMKISDQIDALKLLKIDPVAYLVFPRWIATIFSLLFLTFISIFITMTFAIAVATLEYGFNVVEYVNALRRFVGFEDIFCALVKSMIFGAVIPVISCAQGFLCRGGAQGVGTATTQSVVASTVAVIFLDFVLTYLFTLIL